MIKLKEATSTTVTTQTPKETIKQLQVGLRYISAGLVQSESVISGQFPKCPPVLPEP